MCSATKDSFEWIYSATNPWIYYMIYVSGTLFSIDEYIYRHTHQGNTVEFSWLQVDSRYPDPPPCFSQQALGDDRGCENVSGHGGHRRR